jgi:hypothetical protein
MAYIPNNTNLYNHALAGACGAIAARWNQDPTQADYTTSVNACAALAQAVDTLIPPLGEQATDAVCDLIGRILGGVVQDRFPQSDDPAFYTGIATGVVAFFNQALTAFL